MVVWARVRAAVLRRGLIRRLPRRGAELVAVRAAVLVRVQVLAQVAARVAELAREAELVRAQAVAPEWVVELVRARVVARARVLVREVAVADAVRRVRLLRGCLLLGRRGAATF